jgi:hypothetical protein
MLPIIESISKSAGKIFRKIFPRVFVVVGAKAPGKVHFKRKFNSPTKQDAFGYWKSMEQTEPEFWKDRWHYNTEEMVNMFVDCCAKPISESIIEDWANEYADNNLVELVHLSLDLSKAEVLKQTMAEEDNDLKAMGIGKKVLREERNEKFEEKWLPKFKAKFPDMEYIGKMFCWRIIEPGEIITIEEDLTESTRHRYIDFYPKSNKVFVHAQNKWIKPGLRYLIEKYFKGNK